MSEKSLVLVLISFDKKEKILYLKTDSKERVSTICKQQKTKSLEEGLEKTFDNIPSKKNRTTKR